MSQKDDFDRAPIGIHCPNKPSSPNYINITLTFPPLKVTQTSAKIIRGRTITACSLAAPELIILLITNIITTAKNKNKIT